MVLPASNSLLNVLELVENELIEDFSRKIFSNIILNNIDLWGLKINVLEANN